MLSVDSAFTTLFQGDMQESAGVTSKACSHLTRFKLELFQVFRASITAGPHNRVCFEPMQPPSEDRSSEQRPP